MDIIGMEVPVLNYVQLVRLSMSPTINANALSEQTGLAQSVSTAHMAEFSTPTQKCVSVQLAQDGTDTLV